MRKSQIELNKDWKFKEVYPTISAYVTTWNCISGNYPFIEAIRSWSWCDEVCVIDGGSTDGTREKLNWLMQELPNLKVYDVPLSEEPGKDGQLKGFSRAMCMSEYLIQFDSDEICCGDIQKWKKLCKNMPEDFDITCLPVIEPFGSLTNLRMNDSHNPWKYRISRNRPEITHSIPKQDQLLIDGVKYSKGGSDGTCYTHIITEDMIPFKVPEQCQKMEELKTSKNKEVYKEFVSSFIKNNDPYVLHLGHVNLVKKISLYLSSWHRWWNELYHTDTNIFFPGVKIEDVTQDMITEKVKELIATTESVNVPEIESCLVSTKND